MGTGALHGTITCSRMRWQRVFDRRIGSVSYAGAALNSHITFCEESGAEIIQCAIDIWPTIT